MACWRPRGDSIIYELRRFFIGGSPELEDMSYVAVPSDHEGPILSRMGFRTTTTGHLKIRLNTVFQSQVFLNKKSAASKSPNQLLDQMGNYSNLNDLIGVLEQFNVAKNRMIQARDDSKKILEEWERVCSGLFLLFIRFDFLLNSVASLFLLFCINLINELNEFCF